MNSSAGNTSLDALSAEIERLQSSIKRCQVAVLGAFPVTLAVWWFLLAWPAAVLMVIACGTAVFVGSVIRIQRIRRSLDRLRPQYFKELGAEDTLVLGELFNTGRVAVCDDDAVFLIYSRHPLVGGVLRLTGAICMIALGIWMLNATWGAGTFNGIKREIAGWIALTFGPLLTLMPFTVSWGATRTAADGRPGLLFDRYWFYFVHRIQVIPADRVAYLAVFLVKTQAGRVAELRAVSPKRKETALASGRCDLPEEQRLGCLMRALSGVLHNEAARN